MVVPTAPPQDVESRPVVVWLIVTLIAMLLLAGLAAIIARKGPMWGIKSQTLHTAAVHRPEDIVPLIQSGRDVNELLLGRTPLHQAVTFGKVDSVRLLLQHGADPNLYDPSGTTSPAVVRSGAHATGDPPDGAPLGSGHLNLRNAEDRMIILLLLDAGADPDTPGTFGETLLHKAARVRDHLLMEQLFKLGANVNAQNDRGQTPLFGAVATGNPMLVEMLLRAGADPAIADERGRTPADNTIRPFDESLQERLQPQPP